MESFLYCLESVELGGCSVKECARFVLKGFPQQLWGTLLSLPEARVCVGERLGQGV